MSNALNAAPAHVGGGNTPRLPAAAQGSAALAAAIKNRATPYVAAGDAFLQEIPTTGEDFQCPRPPPPKSIMSAVLPNTPFPKSKERMLGCWGVPEAGIRARIMSISRALGAEKPAAKRPRSYMDGVCGRKLSIMSTVLPNTPSQKSKEQILSFLGGT